MPTLDALQWIIKDNNNIRAESTTNSKPWILFDPDQGQNATKSENNDQWLQIHYKFNTWEKSQIFHFSFFGEKWVTKNEKSIGKNEIFTSKKLKEEQNFGFLTFLKVTNLSSWNR